MKNPTLVDIVSGSYGAANGVLELTISADFSGTTKEVPFTYIEGDTTGIASEVAAWLAAHQDFTLSSYQPPAITKTQLYVERDRRLAAGFSYDFGDARGVHQFGTTDADMKGWDRVTKLKDALLASGDTTTTIRIATKTGIADVTAPEWNEILLYEAAAFEQPIWQASFLLEGENPIPADYAADKNWP